MNGEEIIETNVPPAENIVPAEEQVPFPKTTKERSGRSKKRIILVLGGVVFATIFAILLYFYYFGVTSQKTVTGGGVEISSWQGLEKWDNLRSESSTKETVVRTLGQPVGEKQTPLGNVYTYQSDNEVFPHTVVFDKDNKVSSIFLQVPMDKQEKYSEWVAKYGQPEKEMYNSYAQFSKTYIFAQKGNAVVANEEADIIYSIHCFSPTTLQNYLSSWSEFLFEENPYKL